MLRSGHPLRSERLLAAVVVGGCLVVGVAGVILLWKYAVPGADLATYQRAGADWLATGDPYRNAELYYREEQYRYPPLLAMLMPVLGWTPLWFAIVAVATAYPIWLAYREGGRMGLLLPAMLAGMWLMTLINGNVQPVMIALLATVPYHRRFGAVGMALCTMVKLHPVLGVVWYLGRRDWVALRWYAGALAVLLAVQTPWLGSFVDYYLNSPAARTEAGGSLVRVTPLLWLAVVAVLGIAAYRYANTRNGWLLAILLQLAALPRLYFVNLALVLAAPRPRVSEIRRVPDPAGAPRRPLVDAFQPRSS